MAVSSTISIVAIIVSVSIVWNEILLRRRLNLTIIEGDIRLGSRISLLLSVLFRLKLLVYHLLKHTSHIFHHEGKRRRNSISFLLLLFLFSLSCLPLSFFFNLSF